MGDTESMPQPRCRDDHPTTQSTEGNAIQQSATSILLAGNDMSDEAPSQAHSVPTIASSIARTQPHASPGDAPSAHSASTGQLHHSPVSPVAVIASGTATRATHGIARRCDHDP